MIRLKLTNPLNILSYCCLSGLPLVKGETPLNQSSPRLVPLVLSHPERAFPPRGLGCHDLIHPLMEAPATEPLA